MGAFIEPDLETLANMCGEMSKATGKPLRDVMRGQFRLLIRDVIDITPPAGGGVKGKDAQRRGQAAIYGDLFGGRRVPVGDQFAITEGLFVVSSRNPHDDLEGQVAVYSPHDLTPKFRKAQPGEEEIISLYTSKKGVVYGVEKLLFRPDATMAEMLAHIAKYRSKSTGKVSKAGLLDKTIGRHVFIDRMVISRRAKTQLLKYLFKNVGILAGGWLPAAEATGVKPPAWITRQSSRTIGDFKDRSDESGIDLAATNRLILSPAAPVLKRGIASAAKLRANAMAREIPHIIAAAARKAGFTA